MAENTTKTKKEVEAISEIAKKNRLKFSDILIPFLVVIVLIILGAFVFVPMIKTAIDYQTEYASVLVKETQLKSLSTTLSRLDDSTLQSDLVDAKKVIPNTLKVSSFVYYIDNLATEKSLKSSELSAGDVTVNLQSQTADGTSIMGVSGPLAYSGSFDNIVDFLDSLYSASPYIIKLGNVELEGTSTSDWKVTLNVTGYYVPETEVKVNLYAAFTPYTQYSDIVRIFGTKATELN
jgi:hypothetical protein